MCFCSFISLPKKKERLKNKHKANQMLFHLFLSQMRPRICFYYLFIKLSVPHQLSCQSGFHLSLIFKYVEEKVFASIPKAHDRNSF